MTRHYAKAQGQKNATIHAAIEVTKDRQVTNCKCLELGYEVVALKEKITMMEEMRKSKLEDHRR